MVAQAPAVELSLRATVTLRHAKPRRSPLSHHPGHAVTHQTPASEPPAFLHYPQADSLAKGAYARHAKAAAGMGSTALQMVHGA